MGRATKPKTAIVLRSLGKSLKVLAEVVEFGKSKYPKDDWRDMDQDTHVDAALRHMIEQQTGTELDDESGLHHLAHAASRMLMAIEIKLTETEKDQ